MLMQVKVESYHDSGHNVFCNDSQHHSKGEGTNEPDEVHHVGRPPIHLPNDSHTCITTAIITYSIL